MKLSAAEELTYELEPPFIPSATSEQVANASPDMHYAKSDIVVLVSSKSRGAKTHADGSAGVPFSRRRRNRNR